MPRASLDWRRVVLEFLHLVVGAVNKFPDLKLETDNLGTITGGGGEKIPEQDAIT